jgi:hypothetical protein
MKDRVEKPTVARDAFIELVRIDIADSESSDARRCIDYARYQLGKLTVEAPARSQE